MNEINQFPIKNAVSLPLSPLRYPLVRPHDGVLDVGRVVAHPAEEQRLVQGANHEHGVVEVCGEINGTKNIGLAMIFFFSRHPGCSAFGVHHPTWPLFLWGGRALEASLRPGGGVWGCF